MADSRKQTRIVEYRLQGTDVSLEKSIASAINSLDVLDRKLTTIAAGTRTVSGKDKNGVNRAAAISTAETQIEKLRASLSSKDIQLVSPDQLNLINQFSNEVDKLLNKLDSFGSVNNVTQKALNKTVNSIRNMNTAFNTANIIMPQTTMHLGTVTAALRRAFYILGTIRIVIDYLKRAYDASADFVEVMNLFNVATKGSKDSLYEFANAFSEAFNTDIGPVLNTIAVFRQYANTMGFAANQADLLSKNLTQITYDLASLYNTSNEDMFRALKSGLAGQTKTLMQYGISVHKATIEQHALNLGINKSWSAYSETEKVALRYIAILDQAKLAQGDLARTLESPANQMKILTSQVQVFIRTSGALITILGQRVLPIVNGTFIAFNKLLGVLSKAAGYEIPDYSDNLSPTTMALQDGTEEAEAYEDAMSSILAPMDEINQASPNNDMGLGSIDPAILAALEEYDNLMSQVETKTDIVADALLKVFDPSIFEGIGAVAGEALGLIGAGANLAVSALNLIAPVLTPILTLLSLLLEGVSDVISPFNQLFDALYSTDKATRGWAIAGTIALGTVLALAAAWKAYNAVVLLGNGSFKAGIGLLQIYTSAGLKAIAVKIKDTIATKAQAVAQWWHNASLASKIVLTTMGAGLAVVGLAAGAVALMNSQKSSSEDDTPMLAEGGVVTGPTPAIIGEGRYNEAVVPLGNSPQFKTMKEDIANEVLRKISPTPANSMPQRSGGSRPIILTLNGREVARAILPEISSTQNQVGVHLK